MGEKQNFDVLFLSGIAWRFSWQRHQQIASLFARDRRVLFVEAPLSPAHFLAGWKATWSHWGGWLRGIRAERKNLWIYTAPPVLPLGRSLWPVARINQRLTFAGVKRAISRQGMKELVVWVSDPIFSVFSRNFGQKATIFDWIHTPAEGKPSRRGWVYQALLEEIRERADLIMTPARIIYEKYGKNDQRFSYVPNGVDPELFPPPVGPVSPPAEIAILAPPVIGFIGTIGPAVDLALVEYLARSRPAWSFVFIGEARRNITGLKPLPNLYFLGPRKREELARYLGCCAAGIIPYRVCQETEAVHPVKTYEYLAAGLPVVSTDLPELNHLEGIIELARAPRDFLRLLEKGIAEDSPQLREKRRRVARENSWDRSVGVIQQAIERFWIRAKDRDASS